MVKLNAADNYKITSVNHLLGLRELNAYKNSGIDQNGIRELRQVVKLDASYNVKITSVNHLRELQALDAYDSGIDKSGISELRQIVTLRGIY